jgi:hypothetical protein
MKVAHKPLLCGRLYSRRGRAIIRPITRRRKWDARHARWTPDSGSKDTYVVFRLPLVETELLSFELHHTWHVIDSEDDSE